jgi:hypothetical protein
MSNIIETPGTEGRTEDGWSELQTSHFTLHTQAKAVRAKQTQFPADEISHCSTIASFQHSRPELVVQTKPIRGSRPEMGAAGRPPRGELRQTNPICRQPTGGASALQKRSYGELNRRTAAEKQSQFPARPDGTGPGGRGLGTCTNKPNWRGDRGSGFRGRRPDTRTFVQNEPNSRRRRLGRGRRRRGTRGKCAKRTQFPTGQISRYSTTPVFQARAYRAKQSQFGVGIGFRGSGVSYGLRPTGSGLRSSVVSPPAPDFI